MMMTLFGINEWMGEGELEMSILERPSFLRMKYKSFATGEIGVEIKADMVGESIQSAYIPDKDHPEIVRLNSSLIGSIEGKIVTENNFLGVEYGNEVLGYTGFEAYTFGDDGSFAYEGKFVNREGETCDMKAKCMKLASVDETQGAKEL